MTQVLSESASQGYPNQKCWGKSGSRFRWDRQSLLSLVAVRGSFCGQSGDSHDAEDPITSQGIDKTLRLCTLSPLNTHATPYFPRMHF